MQKMRAFTLIELLIVVAIIAILAAIAVPNFLEAQVRSKVSRVRSDQRSLATALESYYIDNNIYPAMTLTGNQTADASLYATVPATVGRTFRVRSVAGQQLSTLTTPIAYITSYFPDPFADTRGLGFRYYKDGAGWILGSWGPDTDQATGGNLLWNQGDLATWPEAAPSGDLETAYDSRQAQPTAALLVNSGSNGAYTYDPTNGTVSRGDVWRVKQ